jgi:hypothetical protein
MKLAQVVTPPDGDESLLIIADSEYVDNHALKLAMRLHPQHFVPDAEYTLVPRNVRYKVSSKTGNIEEVHSG